jgi:hypothetical protein
LRYLKTVLLETEEENDFMYDNISKIWKILRTDYQSLINFIQINKGEMDKILITFESFTTIKEFF